MKKQFFWVLTLALLALFPYQSAKADLVALNRTNWSAKADNYSNSGNDGPASYAINNNTGNWWHSFYSGSNGGGSTTQTLPHYIQFDLGSVQTFSAFNYVSRSGKTEGDSGNGNIANYQLYVSDSDMTTSLGAGYVPTNGTLVKSDSFTYNGGSSAQDHIVDLGAEYSGQYVLLLATSSANGANWAACAEFYLYYDYDYCAPTVSTQGGTSNYVGQIVTLTTTGAKQDASWTNPVTSNLNGSTSIIENTFTAVPGQTLTLNITDKNTVWGCVRVYVDLNGNNDFDSGEQIFADASRNRTTPISQQFTLSSDIQPGSYLMRVMYVDADATTLTKWACDSYTQGGYYDFRFNVEEGVVVARTVSVSTIPAEGGTVTMNGSAVSSLEASGSITLVATPNSGYKFIGWYEGETLLSQATTYSDNSEEDKEYIAKFEQSYPIMTYIYTNSIQQSNRYLKEVVATQGANVTTVFSATTEGELPRIDPTAASTALTEAQGALVDKTATPIIIDQGATEFTINFKAWTNNMTIGGTSKASELQWTQQALFIDWNKDYDFLDTNENYGKSSDTMGNDGGVCASFISAEGYTRTVTVPAGIQPGTYRMRVCYYEPTDNSAAWNETLFTSLNNQTRNGKSYDFAIQVKEVIPRTITVEASPVEGGVVKANGTVGGVTNAIGVVTITAEANAGYRFENWKNKETSEVVSTDETFTNSQDGNVTYVATFAAKQTSTITIQEVEEGTVSYTVNGASSATTIYEGDQLVFTATAQEGYIFVRWEDGSSNTLSRENPYSVTATANMTVAPVFTEKPYPSMTVSGYDNGNANRYLAKVTASTATQNVTVFNATTEAELPNTNPTTTALIDKTKTATSIKVTEGETELSMTFISWLSDMTINGSTASCQMNWVQQGLYIDWNNDRDFTDSGEVYAKSSDGLGGTLEGGVEDPVSASFEAAAGYTRTIAIPTNQPQGTYRMRVVYYEPEARGSNNWHETLFATGNGEIKKGRAYDFVLEIVEGGSTPVVPSGPQISSSVFTMGESGSQYYRIPALVETANGTLVAIADNRGAALGDLPNTISIVAKTSTDGGKNWSSMKTIAQGNASTGTSYGDAAAVYDEKTGKIITIFGGTENYYDNKVGLWASNSSYPLCLYKSESSDNGATWTTPVDISESIYNAIYGSRSSWIGMFAGSGSAVQLKKGDKPGRLMFVVAARSNSTWGGAMSNYAVYSDDHGATWQVSTTAACTSGDEAKIVELENGDLLMSIKNRADDSSNGSGYRLMAKSTDQGANWITATVNNNLMDPGCNGDVVSIEYGGIYYLLHSLPASTSTRENVTIYISADNGQTWPISKKVYSGYSAYSSLEVLNDGTIGIIVEEGKWDSKLPGSDGFNLKYYNYSMASLLGQAVDVETSVLITEARELLKQTGVGYPSDAPRATLQSAIATAEANPNAEAGVALQTAINAYKNSTEIQKVEVGNSYAFVVALNETTSYYIYNNGSALALETYTEGTTTLPESAYFTCAMNGDKYTFQSSDGKYMAIPQPVVDWLVESSVSTTGLVSSVTDVAKFTVEKLVSGMNDNVLTGKEDELFGKIYLNGTRGTRTDNSNLEPGVIVVNGNKAFDKSNYPYYNGSVSSAIKVIERESPASEETRALIASATELLNQTGVGYPSDAPRATLQSAIATAEANPTVAAGVTLQEAINTYIASEDIVKPEADKTYTFVLGHASLKAYLYNNNGTLAVASYTDGMTLPATAFFTCSIVDGKYMFQSVVDGKYMAYSPSAHWLDEGSYSATGLEEEASIKTKFEIQKVYNAKSTYATASNTELFGYASLYGYRGTEDSVEKYGYLNLNSSVALQGTDLVYATGEYSSAIKITEANTNRTVSLSYASELGEVKVGEDVVATGDYTYNTQQSITFNAVAKEGYVFDRWIIKDSSTGYTRLITTNPLHEELAAYDVFEACFAPIAYADVCKPTFSKTGNTYVVMSATISEGEGIENTTISGIGSNLKKADEVQKDIQNTPSQWGATNVVMAQAGATFKLNIEYMPNWADVELFINNSVNNNGGEFVTLYGPYEGSNSAEEALNNMKDDTRLGSSADNNIISFPVTLDNNLQGGDVVIIRTATGSLNSNACGSASQGGYLDFVFIIEKTAEPRTVKAVSAPVEGGSVVIDGEDVASVETIAPVTLSATANSGYRFVNWTGESREFVTADTEFVYSGDTDTTFVANFVKVWSVTATSNNDNLGTVEIKGANEFGTIDHAAEIELIATSTPSGKFLHWTLDGNPLTSQNPFKTTILKNEVYQAVFEADYPVMKLQYENNANTDNENRSNRYLAKVTATAGNLETIVFEATHEEGLPRVDAEASAYNYNVGEDGEVVPTTSGALIDKTGNTIKVKQGTTSISLNFVAWNKNMTVRFHTAEPELDQTEQAIFVDWNNDKDFLDDGENLGIVSSTAENSFEAADGFNREISIPENIECGTYRMRVIYYDDLGIGWDWTSFIFDEGIINMGRAYDFAIKVVEDENIITFDAPGESVFYIGDKADVTITYKEGMDIYYTTTGIDPDETSPVIKSGETIAINTISEGQVYLKAKAYDTEKGAYTPVFIAVYNVVQKNLYEDIDITLVDDVTTIVGASISSAYGKAKEGAINFDFTQSKKDEVGPIYVEEGATLNLDIDVLLKKYGMRVIAYVKDNATSRVTKDGYLGSTSESIDAIAFEASLKSKRYTYSNEGTRYSISYPIDLSNFGVGATIIYRFITSSKDYNQAPYPNSNQGEGEYVDFVFVVQPQSSITKLAGTAAKDLKVSITTTDACYLSVGGYSQNLSAATTVEVPASLNGAGEMEIQAVGASISNMDIEVLEIGTNVLLPNVDYIGEVTLKSDADFNATTISHASQLSEDGIRVAVEKEIIVPYEIDGKMPTYFNFMSLPFDILPSMNIEYFHPQDKVWKPAILEQDIRLLTYKSEVRAQGKEQYANTWTTWGGTGTGTGDRAKIFAHHGFVLVGNSDYGDEEHKMKVRFKSFYAEGNSDVKRETIYKQDGNVKNIVVNAFRNNVPGGTHELDADWNHVGSPYLTHCEGFDYVLYFHDGYTYKAVSQVENPVILPYQSVMFQANMGELASKEIVAVPLSLGAKTKSAQSVYGRAYLAVNDRESVKIILSDEASENFVVNEDAWYMAPTTDVFSTMSLKVAGSDASISVQPEPNELPLTIYTGAKGEQTISLSRVDGEQNVFLKDAVTGEVVCLNDEDYTFTATPKTTIANRFTVSMIEPTGICDQPTTDGDIKAVVTADGIKLFGTVEGDFIALYSANGMLIANAIAEDGITNIETSANGVIIIKVANETVKVVK